MAINLEKKLEKGQKINLVKDDGTKLHEVCVGVNWGAIQTKGFFGGIKTEEVDLDASCAIFDDKNNLLELVYYGELKSRNGAIRHSGDDRSGDTGGDDGLDNEVISVDFARLESNVDKIAFVLTSYKGQDFKSIPFASIRIYEGTPTIVNNKFATYDIANGPNFAGHVSMVMGVFYKRNGEWKFNAIGEPTGDKSLENVIKTVKNKYI